MLSDEKAERSVREQLHKLQQVQRQRYRRQKMPGYKPKEQKKNKK